ncbi:SRPBCC family protein [Collimonas silvisoli]|uniref:SRPBCC family protein n=1 Tax=Collimonas silvisoli TaxID=2825884 RepID=UPI001B8C6200|nr:SRPBCC family protein [Collimonas silvisoli]
MPSSCPTRHLSITIQRDLRDAYAFVSRPENFAQWASGLGKNLAQVNGEWIADTPDGQVKIRFSPSNPYGVLDHWVLPATGAEIYVPMRLIANGDGCELHFTLFRLAHMSDEKFEADANWVLRDLATLKQLLETH